MLHRNRPGILLAFALLGIAAVASPVVQAATFIVINNDGPGEGFNDATPTTPVGGNTGTTVGAQRLIAFQRAADIWGARLSSSVTIRVRAQFNPLSCNSSEATLGSAGPRNFFRDFNGAPVTNTWYPVALANALTGTDNDPADDDINATFNSSIGTPGCLSSSGWYYGLDGNAPGDRFDFVTVLLHELGHGLGFRTIIDLATGAKAMGFDDAYMRHLERHGSSPSDYPSMSDAQRVAASTDTGNLHWTGTNLRAVSGVLSGGRVGDHVQMFAPNSQQAESSVSHFDTALAPDQVMEPSYTQPLHNPVLELPLFQDIGWSLQELPVNTWTEGDQRSSAVARLAGGGFVVMWMSKDQDSGTPGIYGQRFSGSGAPLGSEFRVNTYFRGGQYNPTVAGLAGGGFVAAWTSAKQDGSGFGVFGQRFFARGRPARGEFQVNTDPRGNQSDASVAGLADGGFVVVWTESAELSAGVLGQRYDADGRPIDGEFRVNTYTDGDQLAPAVAALSRGGFVVTWTSEGQDRSTDGVYAQRFNARGKRAGPPFRVHLRKAGDQGASSVAPLAQNGFVVTWTSEGQDGDGTSVHGRRFAGDGAPLGPDFRVNTVTAGDQGLASVAPLEGGGFVVVWTSGGGAQDGDGDDVFGQLYAPSGLPEGGEFPVNLHAADHQWDPAVAGLLNGGFAATWSSAGQDGSGHGVYGRPFPP